MIETLAQIRGPKFTASIVLWDDKVVETAPRVGLMKGWTRGRVREFCREKSWQISVVHEVRRAGVAKR